VPETTEPRYAHLHVHSDYSILDGACKIGRLLDRVQELGQTAVALTDHGVMSGAIELYREARSRGITPIVGLEAYVVPDHAERPARERRNHITLLAESTTGYLNLIRLCSAGYLRGYHRRPRVDLGLMAEHADGIICLSGCMSGVVCGHLENDDLAGAREHLDRLVQVFGRDGVYLEMQDAGLAVQRRVNDHLRALGAETGLPLVATADVHYVHHHDADSHEALLAIQTRDVLSNPDRFRFETKEFYLKSAAQMAALFPDDPAALARTVEVADRCAGLELPLGEVKLPVFPVPSGETPAAYLEGLCREGLSRRYAGSPPAEAADRLRFELDTIEEMGFSSYFLIVWDYIRWARENGVAVGPGRGSAAGSLVAYTLRITDIDPLEHGLLFERFLNPGRRSLPDIDTDFSVGGRDSVVQYVTRTYGADAVARIGTFGKLLARAVVRDAGRVLGHPYGSVDRIAKLVPERPIGIRLEQALVPGGELAIAYDQDEAARQIIDTARPLEGLVRNEGVHAAGVVIAPGAVTDYLPVRIDDDGNVVTQVPDHDVEALGLLKMDFLGLRNLDVIQDALDLVERDTGERLDIEAVALDDARTYRMLARGDALGVFQFESAGMRDALREVGPTEFADLVALVALYRPGPMAFIPTYARNKRDPSRVTYDDPRLEPITGPSFGVAVYQEQLMAIARTIAGFSPARADDLRKAVGKKDKALMASLKDEFVSGCRESGTDHAVARKLWGLCEAAGDYSFNKAHAACYAMLAYRTAYLKANHPAQYMAAVLTSVMDTKDRVPFYVAACAEMGIAVLPPDVNASEPGFAVTGEREVRFGLTAVKGLGEGAVAAVIAARDEGGPFSSLWDVCRRVDAAQLNRRALESLIRAGALDCTGASRAGMLDVLPQAVGQAQRRRQDAALGQESLFAMLVDPGSAPVEVDAPITLPEMAREELLAGEKEALGLYVSAHPLQDCRRQLARAASCGLSELASRADGERVTVGGMVGSIKPVTTRRGESMAFVRLDDLTGSCEVVVVPAVLAEAREALAADRIVIVSGRVDHKGEGETKIVAQEVRAFTPDPGAEDDRLHLRVDAARLTRDHLSRLERLLAEHRGGAHVLFEMRTADGQVRLRFGDDYRVDPRDGTLIASLKGMFGERSVIA
jgi:DNA polymerase-3 subunit alpha